MGALLGLSILTLIIAGAISSYLFTSIDDNQRLGIIASKTDKSLSIARAGLYIARDSLKEDNNWADCSDANINCNDDRGNGYYPLYSLSLDKTIENNPMNDGTLTVLIKHISNDKINVISIGEYKGKKTYLAGQFSLIGVSKTPELPLVYTGKRARVYGGTLCSYFWDDVNNKIKGITLPNFTLLYDTDTYVTAKILVPDRPVGDNPKNVVVGTDFDTEVKGYKEIDTVLSTGNVYVKDGAVVGKVISNGKVFIEDNSEVGDVKENANWAFPNFNKTLPDLTEDEVFSVASGRVKNRIRCDWRNPNIVVQSGVYNQLYITYGCQSVTFEGNAVFKNRVYVSGLAKNVEFKSLNSSVTLGINDFVNNGKIKIDSFHTDFVIKAFRLRNGSWGKLKCEYPEKCLIDTNTLENYGTFVGNGIARIQARGDGNFIGSFIAEQIDLYSATTCNIVDSNGNSLSYKGRESNTVFDITVGDNSSSNTGVNPVLSTIKQVICKDINDCDLKLNQ